MLRMTQACNRTVGNALSGVVRIRERFAEGVVWQIGRTVRLMPPEKLIGPGVLHEGSRQEHCVVYCDRRTGVFGVVFSI